MILRYFFWSVCSLIIVKVSAQNKSQIFPASGTPAFPKVDVSWNRYYDSRGLEVICKKIAKAYPNLARLSSIGKSSSGKPIWCLTITSFSNGIPDHKPGLYVQGNIHGNEMQGAEYALYTAWYLTESFATNPIIKQLLIDKVFYLVPSVNPDSRDLFIHGIGHEGTARVSSTFAHADKDGDGKINEDGLDDLDGDKMIASMRKKNPFGTFAFAPSEDESYYVRPLALPEDSIVKDANGNKIAKFPSDNHYDYWRREGQIDNDGDGRVDEDGPEESVTTAVLDKFDLNRLWQLDYSGLEELKSLPKANDRLAEMIAIKKFFFDHPNIVVGQDLHNDAGEVYPSLGPNGKKVFSQINGSKDIILFDKLGEKSNELIPGYKYQNIANNPAWFGGYGRAIDWMYLNRGAYSFITELLSDKFYYGDSVLSLKGEERFAKELLMNDPIISWHSVKHPTLGEVEVGGYKKNYLRLTPGFLMEMEAHRNMAFTIYMAKQTPDIRIKNVSVKQTGDGENEITAEIANEGLLPTHSAPDLYYHLCAPDKVLGVTNGALLSSDIIYGNARHSSDDPHLFEVPNLEGNSAVKLIWRVKGGNKFTIHANSVKGGEYTQTVNY